jgi:hypothetical protein
MSNALKNAVESGATTLSDLVGDARSLIEDLPPLANARRKRTRKSYSSIVVVAFLALAAVITAKQLRQHSSEPAMEGGAR